MAESRLASKCSTSWDRPWKALETDWTCASSPSVRSRETSESRESSACSPTSEPSPARLALPAASPRKEPARANDIAVGETRARTSAAALAAGRHLETDQGKFYVRRSEVESGAQELARESKKCVSREMLRCARVMSWKSWGMSCCPARWRGGERRRPSAPWLV